MEKGIYYRFSRMELTQFAILEEKVQESDEIGISCKFRFSYNFEKNLVLCSNTVVFSNNETSLLKSVLDVYFEINSDSVKEMTEGDEFVLNSDIQVQFASMAYGTMRGIIFAKTAGMPLNMYILPPNNIFEVIKDSIRFKNNK